MSINIVGASGYGNMGDEIYPLLFKKYLPEYTLVIKNSDAPRCLTDDCQFLVLGGGGLLRRL